MKHSPTPYQAERVNPNGDILIESGGTYGNIVATVWSNQKEYEENAAFIVTACNNHERLTRENAALKEAIGIYLADRTKEDLDALEKVYSQCAS